MALDNYSSLSAGEIAAMVSTGEVSARAVTEAAFAALDRVEPVLHAFATVAREQAFAAADALDAHIAAGGTPGPLAGVPVAIKDLVLTRGIPTTFGSRLYADYVPEVDDIVVERLRAAGAIILGKSNASEFGFGAHGNNLLFPATGNPWDPALTPGGSSAGSAAAVAAGVCPIAIGSDGGGSVRIPAAFSGLVGIKAAMGRVPLWPGCRDISLPGASGWESIEHIGPLARNVADAALMLSVIAGPDPRDRWSLPAGDVDWTDIAPLPRGLKVAYWPSWGDQPVEPAVRAAVDAAVVRFAEGAGFELVTGQPPDLDIQTAFQAIIALETDFTGMRRLIAQKQVAVTPAVSGLLAQQIRLETVTDAVTRRKEFADAIARVMGQVDLILTPTLPVTAFPAASEGPGQIDGKAVGPDGWCPFTFPFNLTGQPAASVPCGLVGGLPVGLQIVGPHLGDGLVLSAAAAFERIVPFTARPPLHA